VVLHRRLGGHLVRRGDGNGGVSLLTSNQFWTLWFFAFIDTWLALQIVFMVLEEALL
jgi:hypothetical protein